ncbi:hypothetical protein CLU83_2522 [Flavobacterium sp. 1]|uniref:hypothetical protein n=1 Tax=Flavobacterium sp. 1 TaxID=2035200 RepID=UPI000C242B8F|nr:hypothetical protein [Flavobacterium sp. 1]PJJ09188.1 hypothetical protein CLU83_2522 [Flavobacterium sp. 1]
MKRYFFLLSILLTVSCQVTETIHLNPDGSGIIEFETLRDEYSYMQIAKEEYSKEDVYRDTTFVFGDYIKKYNETFSRNLEADQKVFLKYSDVKVHIKESSYEKEFRTTYTQNFQKVSYIVDLSKTGRHLNVIKNNHALSAEGHFYNVSYHYTGNHFNRIVTITDSLKLKKAFDEIERRKVMYKGFKLVQNFVLNYHFPRKIQSVSNPLAKISEDHKSLSLQFHYYDCIQNPMSTNLEVVLEPEAVD